MQTEKPALQFATLRIGIAITILAKIYSETKYLDLLFSSRGIIQHVIAKTLQLSGTVSLQSIFEYFNIENEHLFLFILYKIYVIAAIFLLVGFLSRASALICFLVHMMMFNGYDLLAFGFDGFLFTLLFYTLIFPVGDHYSVDRILFRKVKAPGEKDLLFYIRVLQIHLCIVYATAGIAKLKGHEWIEGVAIWKALNQPQFYTPFTAFFKSLLSYSGISALFSYTTLLLEVCFPVLIFVRKFNMNKIIIAGIIGMHLFIGVVMGLQLFAFVMIVFDVSAFGYILLPTRNRGLNYKSYDRLLWLRQFFTRSSALIKNR